MAIAFVGSAFSTASTTAGTTKTISYVPTAGNTLLVWGMGVGVAVTSVTDTAGNTYTLLISAVTATVTITTFAISPGTAKTTAGNVITVHFASSTRNTCAVAEYSGVGGLGFGGTFTATSAGTTTPTATLTIRNGGSVLVTGAGAGGTATWSANTGNLRNSQAGAGTTTPGGGIIDNTSASIASVTDKATLSASSAVVVHAVELQPSFLAFDDDLMPIVNRFPQDLQIHHQLEDDQWINMIVLPPVVITQPWDTDADQQIPISPSFKDHLSDEAVELVQPAFFYDMEEDRLPPQLPGFQFDDFGNYTYPPIVTAVVPTFVQVNGVTGTTSSISIQMVPNPGNVLVIGISNTPTTTTVTSVTDDAGNSYVIDTTATQSTTITSALCWGFVDGPCTSVTVNFSGSVTSAVVVVAEYAGVAADGVSSKGNLASTALPALGLTIADAGDLVVGFFGTAGAATWSPSLGNIRLFVPFGTTQTGGLLDNTGGGHVGVANRITLSVASAVVANNIELRVLSPAGQIDEYDAGVHIRRPSDELIVRHQLEDDQWTNFIVVPPLVVTQPWDTDQDQQVPKFFPTFTSDEVSDATVELIQYSPGVLSGWDTDAVQQKSWEPYQPDRDVLDAMVELIQYSGGVLTGWDTDAFQQKLWDAYQTDRDVFDNQVELITLPGLPPLDQDISADRWADPYLLDRDSLDTGVELVLYSPGVLTGWDTDAFQQLPQLPSFGMDTLSDEGVEKITLPPPISSNTWDDMAEQQRPMPDIFKEHLSDEAVELIQYGAGVLRGWDTDADSQKPIDPYAADRDLMDTGVEALVYGPGVLTGWDTDADAQKPADPYQVDRDLMDSGVERITLPPLPPLDQDIWSDKFMDPYQLDRDLHDTSVELVQYGPGVLDGWDTDAFQQRPMPEYAKDHLSDEGVEQITLPPLITRQFAFDTDSDSQIPTALSWHSEHISDEMVELIQYGAGVLDGWDTDADQQMNRGVIFTADDQELRETGNIIILPPFIDVVEELAGEDE